MVGRLFRALRNQFPVGFDRNAFSYEGLLRKIVPAAVRKD
jgi:hypothetical protein